MKIELPNYVKAAIDRLNNCEYEAYAVGGCVRDSLIGREPRDWDLCVSAAPQAVTRCFPDHKVLETGIRHGTVTVMMDHHPVEVTTYRVDGPYTDHRRPDRVAFTTNLREDLARRDFTINAMAYHPQSGLVDFFGGQEDLATRVIRCVGEPGKRFMEDALRILRAIRFTTSLDFTLDPATGEAMLAHRASLSYVAVERVFVELCGMDFVRLDPRYLPVLQAVIPELATLPPQIGLPEDSAIRLASLLRETDATTILTRLKASHALAQRVSTLIHAYEPFTPADPTSIRRMLRRIGPEAARQLFLLQGNELARVILDEILVRGDCYSLQTLAVDGQDLLDLGLRGKAVGDALNAALEQVIDGKLANDKETLLHHLTSSSLILRTNPL